MKSDRGPTLTSVACLRHLEQFLNSAVYDKRRRKLGLGLRCRWVSRFVVRRLDFGKVRL